MEPAVTQLYQSSPLPDETAEEDDDEFGDFGGFSAVPPTISPEFTGPVGPNPVAAESLSPGQFSSAGLAAWGLGVTSQASLCSYTRCRKSLGTKVKAGLRAAHDWAESEMRCCNRLTAVSRVLTNGFKTEEPSLDLRNVCGESAGSRMENRKTFYPPGLQKASKLVVPEACGKNFFHVQSENKNQRYQDFAGGNVVQQDRGDARSGVEDCVDCGADGDEISASANQDFASIGQPLTQDGREDFGDFSETPVVMSPCCSCSSTEDHPATSSSSESMPESPNEGVFHCVDSAEDRGEEMEAGAADFPSSDSFADFIAAPVGDEADPGWDAFGEQAVGGAWATFHSEGEIKWQESTAGQKVIPSTWDSTLEQLFRAAFPEVPVPEAQEEVLPLGLLVDPQQEKKEDREEPAFTSIWNVQNIWLHLKDIHNALGRRYQWIRSHGNMYLLSSLGIDTSDTRRPGNVTSAVEMISTAQVAPASPAVAVPHFQFNWNSSGLTNLADGTSLRRTCSTRTGDRSSRQSRQTRLSR